jgi:hypothetical protein
MLCKKKTLKSLRKFHAFCTFYFMQECLTSKGSTREA